MSYILEALKKLEQEKARARKEVDPLRQLTRMEYASSTRPRKGALWHKAAVSIVAGGILVVSTFLITRHMSLSPPPSGRTGPADVENAHPGIEAEGGSKGIAREIPASSDLVAHGPPVHKETPSESGEGVDLGSTEERAADKDGAGSQERAASPGETPSGATGESSSPVVETGETEFSASPESDQYSTEPLEKKGALVARAGARGGPLPLTSRVPAGFPSLKISAIVWSADSEKRFAVVNLRSVREGDAIEGAVVSEIQTDGVVFRWQGNDYRLSMSRH
jgi:hypothetical protein